MLKLFSSGICHSDLHLMRDPALPRSLVYAIAEITDASVDFAFNAIGARETNEQILPATRGGEPGPDGHGGTAILVGVPGEEMIGNPRHFLYQHRRRRAFLRFRRGLFHQRPDCRR